MIFKYNGKLYPDIIRKGNAVKYILPFAEQFCNGKGLDIGGFNDWVFPNATPINITIPDEYDGMNLPDEKYDFIFSSHCLEHIPERPPQVLNYWKTRLKSGGVLFLYLPHPSMEYWLPENNPKHKHTFFPDHIVESLNCLGFNNIIYSERDLYWSFSVVAFKS